MNRRPLIPELILALAATGFLFTLSSASPSSIPPPPHHPDAFNLAERKAKQPWLWATPRQQDLPVVKDKAWPLNSVDTFILHRLETAGLPPAPAAEPLLWLRRVHFALTGLPPTRKQIQAFRSDPRPGARGEVVEQLLASPHFGERWARHWMDLMRYAESRGHEGDYLIANAWHYRDYLIRAFNEDVPYHQFLLEHLAGDLLPKGRLRPGTDSNESVLGTGWAFLGEENHSPVDIRQDECERLDNKIDVFTKTFLGLTVSCARCHDHKFDPISAQDYYALSGFFLGSSFRQVRFEAMENNRQRAAELAELRGRFVPALLKSVCGSQENGLGQISDYLLAAREALRQHPESPSARSADTAQTDFLHPRRLQKWVNQLREALTNQAHPLHSYAQAALNRSLTAPAAPAPKLPSPGANTRVTLPAGATIIADYSQPGLTPWKVDGEAFGFRPAADRGDRSRPNLNQPSRSSHDLRDRTTRYFLEPSENGTGQRERLGPAGRHRPRRSDVAHSDRDPGGGQAALSH